MESTTAANTSDPTGLLLAFFSNTKGVSIDVSLLSKGWRWTLAWRWWFLHKTGSKETGQLIRPPDGLLILAHSC